MSFFKYSQCNLLCLHNYNGRQMKYSMSMRAAVPWDILWMWGLFLLTCGFMTRWRWSCTLSASLLIFDQTDVLRTRQVEDGASPALQTFISINLPPRPLLPASGAKHSSPVARSHACARACAGSVSGEMLTFFFAPCITSSAGGKYIY